MHFPHLFTPLIKCSSQKYANWGTTLATQQSQGDRNKWLHAEIKHRLWHLNPTRTVTLNMWLAMKSQRVKPATPSQYNSTPHQSRQETKNTDTDKKKTQKSDGHQRQQALTHRATWEQWIHVLQTQNCLAAVIQNLQQKGEIIQKEQWEEQQWGLRGWTAAVSSEVCVWGGVGRKEGVHHSKTEAPWEH